MAFFGVQTRTYVFGSGASLARGAIFCKNLAAEDDFEEAERGEEHNKAGCEHPSQNGEHGLFKIEVENAGGESASPGASTRNRDSDKEKKRKIGATVAGFF